MHKHEIRDAVHDAHLYTRAVWAEVESLLPKGMTLADVHSMTLNGDQFMHIYNNLSCLEYKLRKLLEGIEETKLVSSQGTNIVDFKAETEKLKNEKKGKDKL